MPKAMYNLIGQYIEEIKKFMVHMSDRLFYMVRMPEAISGPDSDIDIMILVDMSDIELKILW